MMNAGISSPVQSIIISTYNRKEMLAEAIESVLNQRNANFEVIVIDDCSTDGTEEFVRSIHDERIRYFRNEKNSGLEHNRNLGLRSARGKYITYIDDDDYYTDYDFFSKAINIFKEYDSEDNPLSFVCANSYSLNVNTGKKIPYNIGRPGRVKGLDYILKYKEYRKPLSTFPTVFKSEALKQAGLFDAILFDTATYIQAALEGDAWFMPDVIGVYRTGHASMTLGYGKRDTEHDAKFYRITEENIKRYVQVKEKLYSITEKKTADRWYISNILTLMKYYAIARPNIKDRIKIMNLILSESGFMPKLWIHIMLLHFKTILGKITPIRRLYKKIKYGDSRYGEY